MIGRAADGRKSIMPAWLAFARPWRWVGTNGRAAASPTTLPGVGKGHAAPMNAKDDDANGGWANAVRAVEEGRDEG